MKYSKKTISESLPRYQEIQNHLKSQILSGAWAPGTKVPSEHELAAQFDCARMTVSKAIGSLVEKGLVVRRRRAGTVVAAPRSQETVLEIHDIQAEVQASGRLYRFDIQARKAGKATREEADRLGADIGTPVLTISCVHWADTVPYALEERIINLEAVPEAADEMFLEVPPGSWLLAKIPWNEAEHRIFAVSADIPTARILKIRRNAACLCIERRTRRDAYNVTYVRLIYPGDQHVLVARFQTHGNAGR
ncbi:MAG: histidine utilization repressor [Rhodospirillaceae bacterium]